jgi:hypothetical protein
VEELRGHTLPRHPTCSLRPIEHASNYNASVGTG